MGKLTNTMVTMFILAFAILPQTAFAAVPHCPATPLPEKLYNMPYGVKVEVNKGEVVGDVLYTYNVPGGVAYLTCYQDEVSNNPLMAEGVISSAPSWGGMVDSPLGVPIYTTSQDGVGVRITVRPGYGVDDYYATRGVSYYPAAYSSQMVDVGGTQRQLNTYHTPGVTVEYVKTGVIELGYMAVAEIARLKAQGSPLGAMQTIATVNSGNTLFISKGCAITTPTINIPLGNITAAAFTAVGSTPGSQNFNITLDCVAGIKVTGSLGAIQNADTSNTSVIALTGAGTTGVAGGVGVQILRNGTPMTIGTSITIVPSATSGPQNIEFTARYYQTLTQVLTGDANATVTLNLTYS